MKTKVAKKLSGLSRRDFIKKSAVVGAAALTSQTSRIFAAGSDTVRVGLIGCGGRGTYDTTNCLSSAQGVQLVAIGDLFKDRMVGSLANLKKRLGEKVKVADDKCFVGWDAYKNVIACDDVDLVILTEPPHFRPIHLKAAIEAGKHVFMEKPVAVDPVGVRSVIASSELADKKKLTILAGTQMRRISHLVQGVKSIRDGALGDILGGQCVSLPGRIWNGSSVAGSF
jgi:predicted dehydrogenase